ncbi:MAG: thermonuclease family protein [Saprospiraceae bacterium]|jgi:micrococcal nuclease|nr:thermonuclease family protein [Saprospiraceae bacterium]
MYEYRTKLIKVVDGDTVDVDIDLGFGIWLRDERVRIMGIDTPESRTRNKVEKLFGKAASKRLKELLGPKPVLRTQVARDGEDMKGKFGRILGDFDVYCPTTDSWRPVTVVLSAEGHCVPYTGGSKEDTLAAHLVNREKLLESGYVDKKQYDKLMATGKYI